MRTIQTTIRLDPALKDKLEELSRLHAMTLNKLVTTALEKFVVTDARAMQQELKASLAVLDRIAGEDPRFERAIADTAAAEAAIIEDPVEGEPFVSEDRPATKAVRGILSA